jgi:hypothetical protein
MKVPADRLVPFSEHPETSEQTSRFDVQNILRHFTGEFSPEE